MAVLVEKKAVDLGLLEEDDIFEEFPAEGMLENFENVPKIQFTLLSFLFICSQ